MLLPLHGSLRQRDPGDAYRRTCTWSLMESAPGSLVRSSRERARDSRLSALGRLQRAGDFLGLVALDDVANLDVVEVLDANAALVPLRHFLHVVLEAAQRRERPVEHLDATTNHAHATLAIDHA